MNRTLVIIVLVIVGIYCLPSLLAIIGVAFGIVMSIFGALLGLGISLVVTVLPMLIVAYLIWWLVHDNRHSQRP